MPKTVKSKFQEVFADTQQQFDAVVNKIDSLREVRIKILANNKFKEIGKVVKANDLLKHLTDEDVVIILNEKIFEQLEDEQREMVVEELIATIYFDLGKSKVTLVKPDVNTFSLLLRKFGYTKYEKLHVTINTLLSQEDAEEAENGE